MSNRHFLFLAAALTLVLPACSEFIAKDISKETVAIMSPVNGDTSTSFSQLFWWNEIEGADDYHLQIVTPRFDNIQQLVLDTTIENNRFGITLQPGSYEWRVRAQNNAGFTSYVTQTITIDSTLDLAGQTVQLISPANNVVSDNPVQTFTWFAMPYADSYTFQVLTTSNSSIFINSNVTTESTTYTFPAYGTYKWRVWAQNSFSMSRYAEHTITISLAASTPATPADNDTVTSPVILSWISPSEVIADSLFIYSDASLSTLVHRSLQTATSYSFSGTSGKEYFWRLRSMDASGNLSNYSNIQSFHIRQ